VNRRLTPHPATTAATTQPVSGTGAAKEYRQLQLHGKIAAGRCTKVDVDLFEELNAYRWHMTSAGYVARTIVDGRNRKKVLIHRQILTVPPGLVVDHINADPLDNRRANIRAVTTATNMQRAAVPTGECRFLGVRIAKRAKARRYEARLGPKYLGMFETAEEAAAAYDDAVLKVHGPLATTNYKLGLRT